MSPKCSFKREGRNKGRFKISLQRPATTAQPMMSHQPTTATPRIPSSKKAHECGPTRRLVVSGRLYTEKGLRRMSWCELRRCCRRLHLEVFGGVRMLFVICCSGVNSCKKILVCPTNHFLLWGFHCYEEKFSVSKPSSLLCLADDISTFEKFFIS
jgi:hypothetical protein